MSCSKLVRRLRSGRGPEMALLARLRIRSAVKSPKTEGNTPFRLSLLFWGLFIYSRISKIELDNSLRGGLSEWLVADDTWDL